MCERERERHRETERERQRETETESETCAYIEKKKSSLVLALTLAPKSNLISRPYTPPSRITVLEKHILLQLSEISWLWQILQKRLMY